MDEECKEESVKEAPERSRNLEGYTEPDVESMWQGE
jgi:hypothetical protein